LPEKRGRIFDDDGAGGLFLRRGCLNQTAYGYYSKQSNQPLDGQRGDNFHGLISVVNVPQVGVFWDGGRQFPSRSSFAEGTASFNGQIAISAGAGKVFFCLPPGESK